MCTELNRDFLLQLDLPEKGLLDCANYDSFSNVVPDDVPSIFLTKACLPIQYTTSDGTIAPVSQATFSSNIVFNIYSFQGYISRELVYHSPQVNFSE